jgi:hypothetical protein
VAEWKKEEKRKEDSELSTSDKKYLSLTVLSFCSLTTYKEIWLIYEGEDL